MSLTRFFARKYLSPEGRLPFLTVVAIMAVAVAVGVQILVLSVMHGFRADLMTKFIGLSPHLRIASEQPLPQLNVAVIPSVEGAGILTEEGGIETGIKIRGVTPDVLTRMTTLEWALPQGEDPISLFTQTGEPVVAIGSELAAQLGVTPEGGRHVTLIAPFGQVSPSGDLIPQRLSVKVGGVFRSGLYEIDQSLVLMDPIAAKRLLGPQATEGWWAYVPDPMQVASVARTIRDQHPDLTVTTWQEENAALFGALKLERIVMGILLGLVVAIAATGIVGVLFLLALSRQQEMGILLALGCTVSQIQKIFVGIGAIIGGIGAAIGCLFALFGCTLISRGSFPLPESLYLHTLPVAISIPGIILICCGACILTMLAAWYPTRDMKRADVTHWLRGE